MKPPVNYLLLRFTLKKTCKEYSYSQREGKRKFTYNIPFCYKFRKYCRNHYRPEQIIAIIAAKQPPNVLLSISCFSFIFGKNRERFESKSLLHCRSDMLRERVSFVMVSSILLNEITIRLDSSNYSFYLTSVIIFQNMLS